MDRREGPAGRTIRLTFPLEDAVLALKGGFAVTTTWDDSMATGDPVIDQQHQEIIGLVDDLEAAEAGLHRREAYDLLARVMDFTIAHFTTEESLMRVVHYPPEPTQEMLEQHREFTAYARHRIVEFRLSDSASVVPLGAYLREWLVDHEFGLDRKLVEWIREQPSGESSL